MGVEAIDRALAADILKAARYITSPERASDRAFAQSCYQEIRVQKWNAVHALLEKLDVALNSTAEQIPMDMEEIDLAGDIVECVDVFQSIEAEEVGVIWDRIAAAVGIAGGALGLVAFLR